MDTDKVVSRLPGKLARRKKPFSMPHHFRLDCCLVFFTFLVSLAGALYGEKISINGGLGFDGLFYGELAKRFSPKMFFTPESYDLTTYTVQRILPSVLVNFILRIFHQEFTTANVIIGFALLNTMLLTLSSLAWCLICNKMNINVTGKIIGYIGIFGGFALTKWVSFYPVLTDTTAFTISLWMLYCYLARNRWLLVALTIAGAFTWPTLMYQGFILLLFPTSARDTEPGLTPAPYRLNIWIALVSGLVLVFILQYTATNYTPPFPVYPNKSWLPVSIFVVILYWFFIISRLLNDSRIFTPKHWFKYFHPLTWLGIACLGLVVTIVQKLVSMPDPNTSNYLQNLLITPVDVPGKFINAHIFFFGPIMLVIIFWWKPVLRFVQTQGFGLILNMLLGLIFFLSSESRNLMTFFPIFILGAAQVASSIRLHPASHYIFAILTIIFSRIWLPLNNTPALSRFIASLPSNLLGKNIAPELPLNVFYWGSIGPWTTHQMYLVETVIAAIIGCLLYFTMGRYRNASCITSSPSESR